MKKTKVVQALLGDTLTKLYVTDAMDSADAMASGPEPDRPWIEIVISLPDKCWGTVIADVYHEAFEYVSGSKGALFKSCFDMCNTVDRRSFFMTHQTYSEIVEIVGRFIVQVYDPLYNVWKKELDKKIRMQSEK